MRLTKTLICQLLATMQGANHPHLAGVNVGLTLGKEKGQKRNARPKASGVAASKRLAVKRNNIRKHG